MAEVVVDAKPMPLPDVDPDAKIPESVKKRAAAVEAFYAAGGQTPPESDASSPTPEAPSPQAADTSLPQEVTTPPSVEPSPPPLPDYDPNDIPQKPITPGSWEQKYVTLKSRYETAQRTIGDMNNTMAQMGDELLRQQQSPPSAPRPSAPRNYLTQQDVQNYGTDLVDFAQRAAAQAVSPHLQAIEQRTVELDQRLAKEARMRLDQQVAMAVPNYLEIDENPRWHQWLRLPEEYSGSIRQNLLNQAIANGDALRVIRFFRGFLAEEQATGQIEATLPPPATPHREPAIPLASLAAPGRVRPASGGEASVPADKPYYTRAQITQNYRLHLRGAWTGREAEWNRLERDMIQAGPEGRVRG